MRISDWSSDVCSSDLTNSTSCASISIWIRAMRPAFAPPYSSFPDKYPMAFFTQDQLKAIADALGDTEAGLTGTEIQHLFATCNLNDPGPITKRVRIFNAFAKSQNDKQNRTHIRSEEHTSELQ